MAKFIRQRPLPGEKALRKMIEVHEPLILRHPEFDIPVLIRQVIPNYRGELKSWDITAVTCGAPRRRRQK